MLIYRAKISVKLNTEALLDAREEVGLRRENTFTSRHQSTGQNHKVAFENVAKLKYLGITVTSVYIREEITSRLN
jgi:hypothetical protein